MLKYTDTKVVFAEIPDEITLAINISGCPCACEGCHSSYLAGDVGEVLDVAVLRKLIERNNHISCLSFMGGDGDPAEVSRLASEVKMVAPELRIGWYSGRDELSEAVDLTHFDYVKVGSYQEKFGPLTSPTTNQRLYRVEPSNDLTDITFRLKPSL